MMKRTALILTITLCAFFLISTVCATEYVFTPVGYPAWESYVPEGTSWENLVDNKPNLQFKSSMIIGIGATGSSTNPWQFLELGGYRFDTSSIPDDAYITSVEIDLQTSSLTKNFPSTSIVITDFTPTNPPSWVNADAWEIPQLGNAYGIVSQDDLFVGSGFTHVPLYGYNVNKTGYSYVGLCTNYYYEDSATNPGATKQTYIVLSLAKLIVNTGSSPTPTPTATVTTTPNWTPNVTTYPTPSYIPTTPGTFSPFPTINITNPDLLNLTNSSFFPALIISNIISIWDAILNPILAIFNIIFSIITWPLTVIANVISNLETLATTIFSSLIGYLQFWSLLFNSFFSSIPNAITSIIVLALVLTGVGLLIK